jgi:tRNA A-37 threonylcarbamoyl transferase component Bud32
MSDLPDPRFPTLPDGLARALQRVLDGPASRVQPLDWGGARYWVKRPEAPRSLRWRLQKGDPVRAFRAERAGIEHLARLGAPVPRLVAAGPGFLLIEDAGPTLEAVLSDPATHGDAAQKAAVAAGRALGRMHAGGLAHGRPYLRDICWDGAQIRMIDFETFSSRTSAARQGRDAVLFLASLLSAPGGRAVFGATVRAWRAEAPASADRAAARWVAALRVAAPLARALARVRGKQSEIAGYLALAEVWSRNGAGDDGRG